MKRGLQLLVFGLLSQLPQASTFSQAVDDGPVRCISLTRIDHTEVIDERTIAFYLKGRDIYVNRLERACPQLKPGSPFSYRTTSTRLCRLDSITVLVDYGLGLREGAACTLSTFTPADPDIIDMLKSRDDDQPEVTVEPVDVEPVDVEAVDVEPTDVAPTDVEPTGEDDRDDE